MGLTQRDPDTIVRRWLMIATLVWTFILAVSLFWNIQHQKEQTQQMAINTARANFNKDQAYRLWATEHGGVYVEPTERTPPSPWMAHIPDRDVETLEGKKLTLMNPAYMLRQMMEIYDELYGIRGRITGIVYLNPSNKADAWETAAIRDFEQGVEEKIEIESRQDGRFVRLMRPMVMKQGCQKCHGHLGFENGEVRGGVGVTVPMLPFEVIEQRVIRGYVVTHGGVWFIGTLGMVGFAAWTRRRLHERQADLAEITLAEQVFENALDAAMITDPEGVILRVNPAFSQLTGYEEDEAVGRRPNLIKSDHHSPDFYKEMWRSLLQERQWQGEIWNRHKNGQLFAAWESIAAVSDEQGEVSHFVSSFSDITEKKDAEEHIHHLAHYDALTDLPNRLLFQETLSHAIDQAKRRQALLAVFFMDLDGFKKVNDTLGHRMGDLLLQEVACRLRGATREADTVARLGGDEFTLILEDLQEVEDITRIANKIIRDIAEPVVIDGREMIVTVSIGISLYPQDGEGMTELTKNADIAMYRSKESGKNRFKFFDATMSVREQERMALETALRFAVSRDELTVYYQPKVDLEQDRITGFEALARWKPQGSGMVPPDTFIPLAEELDLITEIDLAILKKACTQGRMWLDAGETIHLAVNVSGRDLLKEGFHERVKAILDSSGFPPEQLELEITEGVFAGYDEQMLDALNTLRALGVDLAIDDFGTGYSSLSYLKNLPVKTLKLDRSFINHLPNDMRDTVLVSTIISLAHNLGLKVVAEGVEEATQKVFLDDQGCNLFQGYLVSPPVESEKARQLLDAQRASKEDETTTLRD
ncbi:MAG: EAL domain-containing protein [Magnetococcales bacterium]|nr:EAL domain-containing protein [Magnetococcales bacterium]